jgi:hypothetical protein
LRVTVVLTDRLQSGTTWTLDATGEATSTEPAALRLHAALIALRTGHKRLGVMVPIMFRSGTVLAADGTEHLRGHAVLRGRTPPKIAMVPTSWTWASTSLASCPLPT